MYNRQYFEIGNDYKIIGNYCIHRYDKNDLFDNIETETGEIIPIPTGCITKYDCNNIVAWIYDNGKIERYTTFDNGDRYYLFGSNMLSRIYKASKHDKRACDFWDNKIDDYNHDYIEDTYILRYGKNDLLK